MIATDSSAARGIVPEVVETAVGPSYGLQYQVLSPTGILAGWTLLIAYIGCAASVASGLTNYVNVLFRDVFALPDGLSTPALPAIIPSSTSEILPQAIRAWGWFWRHAPALVSSAARILLLMSRHGVFSSSFGVVHHRIGCRSDLLASPRGTSSTTRNRPDRRHRLYGNCAGRRSVSVAQRARALFDLRDHHTDGKVRVRIQSDPAAIGTRFPHKSN